MFKFNFSEDKEDNSDFNAVSKEDGIQWHESKEIRIPPNISYIVNKIPRDQILKIDYGCGFTCKCLSPKEVMNVLKERSDNEQLLDVLKADKEHSDLLPGIYEGGLKTWECTKDLAVYFMTNELKDCKIYLKDKNILDLGCGSGILGIMCLVLGANVVFQDYNLEVLETMTMPNIFLNFDSSVCEKVKLYSGDWSFFLHKLMENDISEKFDYILTSETIYNPKNYLKIIEVFKKLLKPNGAAFVAAKRHYFGVGGNLKQFENLLLKNNLISKMCWNTSEGVSRSILKVYLPSNFLEKERKN